MANDGKRKTIRLGKVNQKAAEFIRTKVEAIVAADLAKTPLMMKRRNGCEKSPIN